MPVICVDDLAFRYNGINIMSNFSFAVGKGICWGILGPNGFGDSTLIKNILDILRQVQ
jgi:ABC-2 type transport system ATP-binding protein